MAYIMQKSKQLLISNILKESADSGNISLDDVLDAVDTMNKRVEVEKLHPYKLTPPPNEQGRWQTWVKDASGKNKNVKAKSKEELLDKLIPYYFHDLYLDNLTFHSLYLEWLEYKKTITDSPNTIKRHEQHYKKYFLTSVLHNQQITKIKKIDLRSECNRIVQQFSLTRKEWNNAKGILNGMFEFAVEKGYLSENLMENLRISVKFRQVNRKRNTERVFIESERQEYMTYLNEQFEQSGDTSYLAEYLNFYLGLRVGELVAVKWSDIEGQLLHIVREEIRDQSVNPNPYVVVEHTKTHTDRFVVLGDQALAILERIRSADGSGEYIFVRDGERITSKRIQAINNRYAKRTGKKLMSSHTVRRTYASTLHRNGVPLKYIQEQLGHSSIATTERYIYSVETEQSTYNMISNALAY